MSSLSQSPGSLPPLVERIRAELPPEVPVALVGGAVRDLLLGRTIKDYDFILPEGAMRTARQLADRLGAAYYPLNEPRDYARLVLQQEGGRVICDFTAYQGADMQADLWARDFTINAMAIDLRDPGRLVDPTGGAQDLIARQIRPCLPTSFSSDPVRVLRAVRMATSLEARLPPETLKLMCQVVNDLPSTSIERLRDELFKMLELRQAATALRILDTVGALSVLLPDLASMKGVRQTAPHIYDVWEHSLEAVKRMQSVLDLLSPDYDPDQTGSLIMGLAAMRLGRFRQQLAAHLAKSLNTERSLSALLKFAALYHDVGKPLTRSEDADGRMRFFGHEQVGADVVIARAHALRLSNNEIDRLRAIVRQHMRPVLLALNEGLPSRKAVYHFFKDAGEAGVDVCLLTLADTLATYGTTLTQEKWDGLLGVVRTLLEGWWERPQEAVAPPALVNGHDLITLGISAGPRLGEVLEAIREAQAVGEVSTPEEALDFARRFV